MVKTVTMLSVDNETHGLLVQVQGYEAFFPPIGREL